MQVVTLPHKQVTTVLTTYIVPPMLSHATGPPARHCASTKNSNLPSRRLRTTARTKPQQKPAPAPLPVRRPPCPCPLSSSVTQTLRPPLLPPLSLSRSLARALSLSLSLSFLHGHSRTLPPVAQSASRKLATDRGHDCNHAPRRTLGLQQHRQIYTTATAIPAKIHSFTAPCALGSRAQRNARSLDSRLTLPGPYSTTVTDLVAASGRHHPSWPCRPAPGTVASDRRGHCNA